MRSEILNPNIMHHRGSVGQEQPLAGGRRERNTQEGKEQQKKVKEGKCKLGIKKEGSINTNNRYKWYGCN